MYTFGPIFRELRKQKGLTLEACTSQEISKSFLSKFERGESDISLTRFLILLEKLSLTINEFDGLTRGMLRVDEMETFNMRASSYLFEDDIESLKQLYLEKIGEYNITGQVSYQHQAFLAQTYIARIKNEMLPEETCQALSDYLFSVEIWSKYEIIVLGNCIPELPLKTVDPLVEELLKAKHIYGSYRENIEMRLIIAHNMLANCVTSKSKVLLKKYVDLTDDFIIPNQWLGYKLNKRWYKLLSEITKENKNKKVQEIEEFMKQWLIVEQNEELYLEMQNMLENYISVI